jgi:hypothetical protein
MGLSTNPGVGQNTTHIKIQNSNGLSIAESMFLSHIKEDWTWGIKYCMIRIIIKLHG